MGKGGGWEIGLSMHAKKKHAAGLRKKFSSLSQSRLVLERPSKRSGDLRQRAASRPARVAIGLRSL